MSRAPSSIRFIEKIRVHVQFVFDHRVGADPNLSLSVFSCTTEVAFGWIYPLWVQNMSPLDMDAMEVSHSNACM